MPLIEVKRKGVTPSVRRVPTATCAVLMPMTLERAGKELKTENEEPAKVESMQDAFDKFQPQLKFQATAGKEEAEFLADFVFRSIKDFDPENLLRHQGAKNEEGETVYRRNDLADLKNKIDLLYRLKDRWKLPAVRRAWARPDQRKEIIAAFGRLRAELQKVAGTGGQS
jgi:type VI secretion system protein ImpB